MALSFDSDHETNELREGGESIGRLSQGQYGNRQGIPRILSILGEIKAGTKKPYGLNIPLNNPKAPEMLDIAYEARIPVMVASQGGPREHLARFRAIGTKWLHVVASVEHVGRRRVGPERLEPVHHEVHRVVAHPLHRQLDHAGRLAV